MASRGRVPFVISSPVAAAQNRNDYAASVATFGGCMDALSKLQASGKRGRILLPRDGLDLSPAGQGLPLLTGVEWKGDGWDIDTGAAIKTGTIVQGNGTFPIFYNADVDGASQSGSVGAMRAECQWRGGVRDVAIVNGSYGIKSGSLYKGGWYEGFVENVFISNCTQWSMWLENCIYGSVKGVRSFAPAAKGNLFFGNSSGTLWNHGNMNVMDLFCEGSGELTRQIVLMARGGNSALNDMTLHHVQANAGGARRTYSCTASSATTLINVPDASVFPVDMSVATETTVYGFNNYTTYFVKSSNTTTNQIELSYFMGGAAITPSGTGSITLVKYGWPALECVGYGDSSNNTIQASQLAGIDTEGKCSTMRVLQNATITAQFGTSFGAQGVECSSTLTCRATYGTFTSEASETPDFDWSSHGAFLSGGYTLNAASVLPSVNGQMPQGLLRTSGNGGGDYGLHLGTNAGSTVKVAMKAVNSPGQSHLYPAHPISQRIKTSSATSLNLNASHAGAMAFTGNSAANWPLPTLSGTAGGDANTYLGIEYELANCGSANLTIPTATNQFFNNQSGKNTVTLTPGQSFSIRGQVSGSTFFWQVTGNNGVTI